MTKNRFAWVAVSKDRRGGVDTARQLFSRTGALAHEVFAPRSTPGRGWHCSIRESLTSPFSFPKTIWQGGNPAMVSPPRGEFPALPVMGGNMCEAAGYPKGTKKKKRRYKLDNRAPSHISFLARSTMTVWTCNATGQLEKITPTFPATLSCPNGYPDVSSGCAPANSRGENDIPPPSAPAVFFMPDEYS